MDRHVSMCSACSYALLAAQPAINRSQCGLLADGELYPVLINSTAYSKNQAIFGLISTYYEYRTVEKMIEYELYCSDGGAGSQMDNISGAAPTPIWNDAKDISALADSERHLGHIVRTANGWAAYDATHAAESGNGFRLLGLFESRQEAKFAVESHIARSGPPQSQKYFVV